MKIKTIIIVLGMLLPLFSVKAQEKAHYYYVDETIPNFMFPDILGYRDSSAHMEDLMGPDRDKILIFDFWFTGCTSCLAMFPLEDSLQRLFQDRVQFVLVTFEPKEKVIPFLNRWQKANHIKLHLPIIVDDTLLHRSVYHQYDPHYAWIDYRRKLVGQTSEDFISAQSIDALVKSIDRFYSK